MIDANSGMLGIRMINNFLKGKFDNFYHFS